jgi:hypothetical protein
MRAGVSLFLNRKLLGRRPLEPDERVENPAYTRWTIAAPGTVVVYDETTDAAGAVTRGRRTYRLAARTEDMAEVEAQDVNPADGKPIPDQAQTLKHLRWMAKPTGAAAGDPGRPAGTYETGTAAVAVNGKTYQAKWYKSKGRVEAGETDTQAWYSDAVPGGLVKSVHRIPAIKKTITTELTEVRTP